LTIITRMPLYLVSPPAAAAKLVAGTRAYPRRRRQLLFPALHCLVLCAPRPPSVVLVRCSFCLIAELNQCPGLVSRRAAAAPCRRCLRPRSARRGTQWLLRRPARRRRRSRASVVGLILMLVSAPYWDWFWCFGELVWKKIRVYLFSERGDHVYVVPISFFY
jgi:hypothetical protein